MTDPDDAPEPCDACTSFRTVEHGSGLNVSDAPIVVCRRAEANMCPAMLTRQPLRDGDLS